MIWGGGSRGNREKKIGGPFTGKKMRGTFQEKKIEALLQENFERPHRGKKIREALPTIFFVRKGFQGIIMCS